MSYINLPPLPLSIPEPLHFHALQTLSTILLPSLSLSLSLSVVSATTTTATMFEEAMSLLSIWQSLSVPFLLLNLMILAIVLTSGFALFKPPPHLHPHHYCDATAHHHHSPLLQTQLTRSFSVLQRFKSLNFYNYIPNFPIHHHHPDPPAPATDPIPETESEIHVVPEAEDPHPLVEENDDDDEGPTMDEIYSRIIQSKANDSAQYGRQNSDTKPTGGEVPVRLSRKIKKLAGDKSAFDHFEVVPENKVVDQPPPPPSTVEKEEEEEEEDKVDVRAEDFIKKFWNHLKVQRLNSIQRYKKLITTNATAK